MSVNSLNQKSRIILVARSFDESVFSIGEWLASQGVAFRCIEYHPFTVENRTFLSFAVRFDRSREPLYQLALESRAPQFFWHNVGGSPVASSANDIDAQDAWWQHHLKERMISASFSNEPADAGDNILNSYVARDTVFAYASGFGAIGWGAVDSPNYDLVSMKYDKFAASGRHRHRLKGIRWQNAASSVRDAITAKELKERFGLNHPIQTKSRIRRDQAEALIAEMKTRFDVST